MSCHVHIIIQNNCFKKALKSFHSACTGIALNMYLTFEVLTRSRPDLDQIPSYWLVCTYNHTKLQVSNNTMRNQNTTIT